MTHPINRRVRVRQYGPNNDRFALEYRMRIGGWLPFYAWFRVRQPIVGGHTIPMVCKWLLGSIANTQEIRARTRRAYKLPSTRALLLKRTHHFQQVTFPRLRL